MSETKTQIEKVRSLEGEKRREAKSKLPLVIPAGTFKGGKGQENIIKKSGVINLDIDDLDPKELDSIRQTLNNVTPIFGCNQTVFLNFYM